MAVHEGQTVRYAGTTAHVVGVHQGGFQIVDSDGVRHVLSDGDAVDAVADAPVDAKELEALHVGLVERERMKREG